MATIDKIPLIKPSEFQRRNRHLFPSRSTLYRHIAQRNNNGLLESGGVVEAPTGALLIDPAAFERWLRGAVSKSNGPS